MNQSILIKQLNRVGPTIEKKLNRLGIYSTEDLIYWFPFRYEDFQQIIPINSLQEGMSVTIKAKIELIQNKRSFKKRKIITESLASDATGSIRIIWFNQSFITKNIKIGDLVNFSGIIKRDILGLYLSNPIYELIKPDLKTVHTARLLPIYPLTSGITQKMMRNLVKQAFELEKISQDWLPKNYLQELDLIDLNLALKNIHFPETKKDLFLAEQRLKFEELFLIQLKAELSKIQKNNLVSAKIIFKEKEITQFVKSLPFKLTKTQKISAWEILQDLSKAKPMNRLLSGDVGSGKTVVALMAILNTVLNNYQSVLMAPTEILARQHFFTLTSFLKDQYNIALLTSSDSLLFSKKIKIDLKLSKKKQQKIIFDLIQEGEVQIIVGTHSLLSDKLIFKDVGLVIVDEQHRFGVSQRKKIKDKTEKIEAHYLSMTATPIPRSFALMIYGDLDISIINELPLNRKNIITRLVEPHNRTKAYQFIREQIKKGGQVFIICPLITEGVVKSESSVNSEEIPQNYFYSTSSNDKKTVLGEYEKFSKIIFPDLQINYLHGKMKNEEKNEIIDNFKNKKIDILISTSIVEVGIDIPGATTMIIEDAERFGLAQLHQFRGRVGRNDRQAYCFVFTNSQSEKALTRLKYFESINNGFSLAEKDLATRGPGEVYGTTQSGLMQFRLAKLTDKQIIEKARFLVKKIAPQIDKLPLLKQKFSHWSESVHFE